jgi:xylan 1,4-beta-xylosidase
MDYFRVPVTEATKTKQKHTVRLTRIINYINEHYKENFSLSDLAESEQLSVPYLSNFFDKHMGIKFSKYYTNVKLEHAVSDLMKTNHSIETIALNNGFTEYHAFIRAFKKKYIVLPSAYRKEKKKKEAKSNPTGNFNYLLVEPENIFTFSRNIFLLNRIYITKSPKKFPTSLPLKILMQIRQRKNFDTLLKNSLQLAGQKSSKSRYQMMLKDIQENIGYEYIKFHGILSDDMLVCTRSGDDTFSFDIH